MIRHVWALFAPAILTIAACGGGDAEEPLNQEIACHSGAYRMAGGDVVAITPVEGSVLRWRHIDGRVGRLEQDGEAWRSTRGWTGEPDGVEVQFGDCADGRITLDGEEGARIALDIEETRFQSGELSLRARLVMPEGGGPAPVAVLVHGSEDYSAVDFYHWQWFLPAQGVGVLVYDKRGTGGSEGEYSQNFHDLAGDAVAAAGEARRLAGDRVERLGFIGGSQAGWIIPIASNEIDPDFNVIGYGLAFGPLMENRDETVGGLRALGYEGEALEAAGEIADAAGVIIASGFREGYAEMNELKRRYRNEPWFDELEGEFTGQFVTTPSIFLRIFGPSHDRGTSWDHDPLPELEALSAPTLWILAGEDREAPPESTRTRLLEVNRGGAPLTVAEFPDTDHGIIEFVTREDGSRAGARYAEGYHEMIADWAEDSDLDADYPRAMILTGEGGE